MYQLPPADNSSNPILQNSFLTSKYFNPDYLFSHLSQFFQAVWNLVFGTNSYIVKDILAVFAIFFLTVIAYCAVRMLEIRAKEHHHLEHEIAEYAHHHAEAERKLQKAQAVSRNPQWVKVLQDLFSESVGDWKLAIIEADTMLEKLLHELGYKGETLGDMLKSADRDKFHSLTSAWEVHTIRNRIAHEGSTFELSQREAKRVIALYEQIFREFGYI